MIEAGRFERRRVALCVAPGVVAAVAVSWMVVWQLGVLVGWMITVCSLLVWIGAEIASLDAAETARVATREDSSRNAARVVLVTASITSLVVVVAALHRASSTSLRMEVALTSAAMASVVLSWLVVHTVFLLRYAHLYYGGGSGGIEFPGGDRPNYRDFAYLAFTVGMTFQVSDTAVTDAAVRATVLRHAMLSYVFGTAIIASTINVLAGLVG